MRSRRTTTREQVEKILTLAREQIYTDSEVAEKVGVHRVAVQRYRSQHGILSCWCKRARILDEMVRELHERGWTQKRIAKECNVSRAGVQRSLERQGMR